MAARRAAARRRAALPVVTVAKLQESGRLLERLVQRNLSVFVDGGQQYREAHRAGTSRGLHAAEATQLAVALAEEEHRRIDKAVELQGSGLRAYDEPDAREVLLAGGAATAPAFVAAACEFVALVEMDSVTFRAAREAGALEDAIREAAAELEELDLADARGRAAAAMGHYAKAAGVDAGNVWGLLIRTVTQALAMAVRQTGLDGASPPSQLIDSAASTAGTEATSSTSSPGPGLTEQPS